MWVEDVLVGLVLHQLHPQLLRLKCNTTRLIEILLHTRVEQEKSSVLVMKSPNYSSFGKRSEVVEIKTIFPHIQQCLYKYKIVFFVCWTEFNAAVD